MSDVYEELRPLLFSIAYRMVGSASEAEDIVQEAFLRYHDRSEEVEAPRAFLSTVTTRLAIDHLRSARVRRETYVGPWLPEPLVADATGDPSAHAEIADSLSLAFLVLLENLTPLERAVFLLREVFGYSYEEIARIVDRSEDNCRQLATRARRHLDAERPRFEASREQREELTERFMQACETGDADGLIGLLAADVVAYTDGGGKARAAPRPIYGRDKVARFVRAISRPERVPGGWSARPVDVNGQPGRLFLDGAGEPIGVLTLDVAEGMVQAVRIVANPDKLGFVRRYLEG